MPSEHALKYRKRPQPKLTAANLEALLRSLQNDIEACRTSEAVKQRRRQLLKGFRAALWTMADKPRLGEIAQVLRAELFGHTVELLVGRENKLCHSGADDEVESDD